MQETLETWVWSLGREVNPGVGNGNPLQYSCLEDSTDRGDWWATVHGVTENETRLSNCVCLGPGVRLVYTAWHETAPCDTVCKSGWRLRGVTFRSHFRKSNRIMQLNKKDSFLGESSPLMCMHACVLSRLSRVQLCATLDCSPPGSSVHGSLQARTLEWTAVPSSRGSSHPGVKPPQWQASSLLLALPGKPQFHSHSPSNTIIEQKTESPDFVLIFGYPKTCSKSVRFWPIISPWGLTCLA